MVYNWNEYKTVQIKINITIALIAYIISLLNISLATELVSTCNLKTDVINCFQQLQVTDWAQLHIPKEESYLVPAGQRVLEV
jgi:hypothetical protein